VNRRAIMNEMATLIEDDLGAAIEKVSPRLDTEPTPPCIDIYPADPSEDDVARGFNQASGAHYFTVRLRVNTADHDEGQDTLYDLMDAAVATVLEDDQSLNGYAGAVKVEGPTGLRNYIDEGGTRAYLGCEWHVTVLPAFS